MRWAKRNYLWQSGEGDHYFITVLEDHRWRRDGDYDSELESDENEYGFLHDDTGGDVGDVANN